MVIRIQLIKPTLKFIDFKIKYLSVNLLNNIIYYSYVLNFKFYKIKTNLLINRIFIIYKYIINLSTKTYNIYDRFTNNIMFLTNISSIK